MPETEVRIKPKSRHRETRFGFQQLQSRLKMLVGSGTNGLFRVRSLAQTTDGYMAPLADKKEQATFIANVNVWDPDVIIFDTKTSVFKHDTNEQAALLAVNEFLIKLRSPRGTPSSRPTTPARTAPNAGGPTTTTSPT